MGKHMENVEDQYQKVMLNINVSYMQFVKAWQLYGFKFNSKYIYRA